MPFFLIAHYLSYLFNFDQDGYSKMYPILMSVAALFYLLIGLIFLNSSMRAYNIKEWQKALVLFVSVFGTNLFYYTSVEPGTSHVFSFAFISMFFYFSKKYFLSLRPKYILVLAALLGMITLIRPVNAIIIFIIPFAAGNFKYLKNGFQIALRDKKYLIFGCIAFLGIMSIQLILYKVSTGHYFVYSYGKEGFNFLSPHMFDILFSYKKGLFLYTPLYLLSLSGCYFLWHLSRFEFYSWCAFFILITYVFSSWWMWYYGGSFSSRVYVEFIPLFMILAAISLNRIKHKSYRIVYIISLFLVTILCQIQTYQYRYYQIHWSEMTKEKYWNVFMRIDKLIK
jgi:hypothetical protein